MEAIQDFIHYIKYEKGYSSHTIEAYENDLSEFFGYLTDHQITDIKNVGYKTIYYYIIELGDKGLKASSIERKTATIKSYFKYLVKNQGLLKNPAALVASPKKEKHLPGVLEKEEVLALIESIPESDPLEIRNKAMLTLLYSCGLRVSELAGLDLRHIDFQDKVISVIGKGNKQRLVPAGNKALAMLEKYLPYRKELSASKGAIEAVFITKSGRRIQERMVRYVLDGYITALSIQKHVSPHTLRHTFATHMLQNGANIRVIQEILGHSSLSTTQIYTHLTIDKLKESYEKFHPHA